MSLYFLGSNRCTRVRSFHPEKKKKKNVFLGLTINHYDLSRQFCFFVSRLTAELNLEPYDSEFKLSPDYTTVSQLFDIHVTRVNSLYKNFKRCDKADQGVEPLSLGHSLPEHWHPVHLKFSYSGYIKFVAVKFFTCRS